MTEDDAREWVAARYGAAGLERLGRFVAMLIDETGRQNLIAPSTIATVWSRHIVDSAQLANFTNESNGPWLDIGTGGGMPGLVLALLLDRPFVLCEPRTLRADFLRRTVEAFDLTSRVDVAHCRADALRLSAATITARAVASLDTVLQSARHCAGSATTWILPRGQSVPAEIEASTMLRPAMFHVEPSLTDPASGIVVARGLGA